MKNDNQFHPKLKKLIDNYILTIYEKSKSFPKDETYGLTSQLRRSALSIMLNYIEVDASMKELCTCFASILVKKMNVIKCATD